MEVYGSNDSLRDNIINGIKRTLTQSNINGIYYRNAGTDKIYIQRTNGTTQEDAMLCINSSTHLGYIENINTTGCVEWHRIKRIYT